MHRVQLYTKLWRESLLEPHSLSFEKDNAKLPTCSWSDAVEAIPQQVNAVVSMHVSALPDCGEKTKPVCSKSHFQIKVFSREVSEINNIYKIRRPKEKFLLKNAMTLKCMFSGDLIFRRFKCMSLSIQWTAVHSAFWKTGHTHTYMFVYIFICIYTDIHTWKSNFMLPGTNIFTHVFCIHIPYDMYLHNTYNLNKHIVLLIAQRCYFPYNRHYLPRCIECLP